MQWFKSVTSSDYIAGVHHMDWPSFNRRLWQRNYYERIVRSDLELDLIRAYIEGNPAKWQEDTENPIFQPSSPS
jgi:putative transposase